MPTRNRKQRTRLQDLAESFRRSLLAENKTPNTVEIYSSALARFSEFVGADIRHAASGIKRQYPVYRYT